MFKNTLACCLLAFWVATLSGCQSGSDNKNNNTATDSVATTDSVKTSEKPKNINPQPSDVKYNQMARLLAGLPAEEGSKLAKYRETEAWKEYKKVADKIWEKILHEKRPAMIEWQKKHLQAPNAQAGTLFYPFSGPDFLHATTFFPNAKEIVMMGLEPIGNWPDIENISTHSPKTYYKGLERALYAVLKYSFFITKDMDIDFTGRIDKRIDGTLPALLIFLARTGHRIIQYNKVVITKDGKLEQSPEKFDKSLYYGTKIIYNAEGSSTQKTLYFFGVNLSNTPYRGLGGLTQRTDLTKYIQSLKPEATYLKSASYLMHNNGFSMIRDMILKQSKYVLQDDSGMAFKNFTKNKDWDITLFGRYAGPINLFRHLYQQDMKLAYQKDSGYTIKELPFGIGYQYKKGDSNLILAKKK